MKAQKWSVKLLVAAFFLAISLHAQQSDMGSRGDGTSPVNSEVASGLDSNSVPRIIKFSGTIN